MRALILGLTLILATGCLSARERVLIGTWQDVDSGARYVFDKVDRKVQVTQVIDRDGEAFELLLSDITPSAVGFTYQVPSTSYVVTCTQTGPVQDGTMRYGWSSSSPESGVHTGEETMQKVSLMTK